MYHVAEDKLEAFADAWNSGSAFDGIIPHQYIAKFKAAYGEVLWKYQLREGLQHGTV